MAVQTATLFHASAETEMLGGCPTLKNDAELSASTLRMLRELLGDDRALLSSELGGGASKFTGSEDFANITHAVPSLMVALAAGMPKDGYVHPAHHPQVRFDESVLTQGASVYAAMALNSLG